MRHRLAGEQSSIFVAVELDRALERSQFIGTRRQRSMPRSIDECPARGAVCEDVDELVRMQLAVDRHGNEARMPAREHRFDIRRAVPRGDGDSLARQQPRIAQRPGEDSDASGKLIIAMTNAFPDCNRRQLWKARSTPLQQSGQVVRRRPGHGRRLQSMRIDREAKCSAHRLQCASPPASKAIPMSTPKTMRYINAREPGPPEVLEVAQMAVPSPKPGEVLVEVAYAGVNRPDCVQRAGLYPPPPDASPVIGLEVSGRVVALGEGVTQRKIGDMICALTPGGGYAEYCTVPAVCCLPLPRGMYALEAASLPENYFTVWNNVFDRVH